MAGRSSLLTRALSAGLVLGLLATVLGGCGASGPPAARYEVQVATFPGAGRALVDGAGYTLYIYVFDHRGRSTCTAACAVAWPPLLLPRGVTRPVAGPGAKAALLGTTRRGNGSLQVTYNRWPLYQFRNDNRGQATGQGEGMGAWYLISPDGAVNRQPVTGKAGG